MHIKTKLIYNNIEKKKEERNDSQSTNHHEKNINVVDVDLIAGGYMNNLITSKHTKKSNDFVSF